MSSRRMEFKGGWWADIRTAWSYSQDAAMAGAWTFADDADAFTKAALVTMEMSVIDARLPDTDGKELPFDSSIWSKVDGRIGRKIFLACREEWNKWQVDTDPKDGSSRSSGSLPESPPESPRE